MQCLHFFFFNDTATTEIYTLSYTTLFRSLNLDDREYHSSPLPKWSTREELQARAAKSPQPAQPKKRSEEHTSELQSRPHLVCRLLLDKKTIVSDLSSGMFPAADDTITYVP